MTSYNVELCVTAKSGGYILLVGTDREKLIIGKLFLLEEDVNKIPVDSTGQHGWGVEAVEQGPARQKGLECCTLRS